MGGASGGGGAPAGGKAVGGVAGGIRGGTWGGIRGGTWGGIRGDTVDPAVGNGDVDGTGSAVGKVAAPGGRPGAAPSSTCRPRAAAKSLNQRVQA